MTPCPHCLGDGVVDTISYGYQACPWCLREGEIDPATGYHPRALAAKAVWDELIADYEAAEAERRATVPAAAAAD